MAKLVIMVNFLMTIPFGVLALILPGLVFSGFGLTLDAGGQLAARGYAVTCLAYGMIYLLLRNTTERPTVKALLVGSLVFNAIEVIIQITAVVSAIAQNGIWVTLSAHIFATVITVIALSRSFGSSGPPQR